jgi:hypothetical protein
MKTATPINNIDDLFRDLLEQYEALREDPSKLNKVMGLATVAGRLTKIAEVKFMVSVARGIMPTDPMFGDFEVGAAVMLRKGEVSAKELAYREFRAQIKNKPEEE